MGLPVANTLRAAGLSPSLFDNLPVNLGAASYFHFWKAMEDHCDMREIPLLITQALDIEVFSTPLYAAVCSHNLRQAARRVAFYKALTGPIIINVEEDASHLMLTLKWPMQIQPPLALLMSEILFWVYLARKCTRLKLNPVEITTPVLPRSMPQYLDYLGAPIRRSDEVSITFSADDADKVFISGNDVIWSALEPNLKDRLASLQASRSLLGRVRIALVRAIPADNANVVHIADALSMTPRTLQRRLQAEGANFKALLNSSREELAKNYLSTTKLPLAEISYLLGYKEPSSFNRAFRVWVGTTPQRYRQQISE